MESRPQKILITGGLGFIFSHVTEYFVAKGWQVVVIDNLSAGSQPQIINGTFMHHHLDVADEGDKVMDVIRKENPEFVIHAAAISDVDHSIKQPHETLRKNMMANINVFEACRHVPNLKKFLYISTDEVYGECEDRKHENDLIFPKNPYSCSKAVGSLLRIAYDNTYAHLKRKTAETRFCNVFGDRQETRKIMPIIKRSLATGEPVPLFDRGGSYREYIYVENIPPAIELILEKGHGVYNVTLNDGYTVADLVKKVQLVTNKNIPTTVSHRPGIDMKYQMKNDRIIELGWKPIYAFEEGLKKYLEA